MTGQFQKTLAELDEDLEGKHRPSCLDVSARARHPEGIRAAEGTAGNHVGKMCAEETCCERGRPGLGAKHAGTSAPRGAVHLGGRTVPRRCPSRRIWPALHNTDSAHQKSAHRNQKRRSQPSDELGKHWVPLWQTGLCINLPPHDLLTRGLIFKEEHGAQHLTRDPCSRGRPRDCTSVHVSDRIVQGLSRYKPAQ